MVKPTGTLLEISVKLEELANQSFQLVPDDRSFAEI